MTLPRFGLVVVRGRSMAPALAEGDVLLVRYDAEPQPGKLVVVRLPERPVAVKRAVRREADGWWVQRDNPDEGVDSWVVGTIPDADVLAVVICRLRPLRRATRAL